MFFFNVKWIKYVERLFYSSEDYRNLFLSLSYIYIYIYIISHS